MSASTDRKFLLSGFLLIIVVTIFRIFYLKINTLDLFFDEAQYWYWSTYFDFGYYSKPPMIAWIIGLFTNICGETEFCIRLASPFIHMLTSIIIYFIGLELFNKKSAIWGAITYITLPAVFVSSLVISTDVSLLFFWSLSLLFFIKALKYDIWKYWILAGIAAGFGMMSKYNMVVFLLSAMLYLFSTSNKKYILSSQKFWVAIFIALVIFIPNIIWNFNNGFASFLHTKDNANLSGTLFHFDKLFKFILSQFAVFGPILFSALILIILKWKNLINQDANKILLSFIVPLLGIIMLVSFLSRAHANWAAPIYIAATLLVVNFLIEKPKLLIFSITLHISIILIALNGKYILNQLGYSFAAKTNLAAKQVKDPTLRLTGYKLLGEEVSNILKQYPDSTLLTFTRKLHSELLYYVKPHPFNAVKWNPSGRIKDHFDLTTDINKVKNSQFIFVSEYDKSEELQIYFNKMQMLDNIELNKTYYVIYLEGFKGYE